MKKVEWNYSDRAKTYDKRADYSLEAISRVINAMGLGEQAVVADIGAGTAKLTVCLAAKNLVVSAVEPNAEMKSYGIKNTVGMNVTWYEGTAEEIPLENQSYEAVFFGSSFNVVDQSKALAECCRILKPRGWFACMWNHRNLDDPLQNQIEELIKSRIPGYSYGLRRESPEDAITSFGRFGDVEFVENSFTQRMSRDDIIDAWRSHATLARQAGDAFDGIISEISDMLRDDVYEVPYTTRIWFAQMK